MVMVTRTSTHNHQYLLLYHINLGYTNRQFVSHRGKGY